jgi:hypothetical protein
MTRLRNAASVALRAAREAFSVARACVTARRATLTEVAGVAVAWRGIAMYSLPASLIILGVFAIVAVEVRQSRLGVRHG